TANGTTENPTHQYTTAGTYTVILTITDVDGDSNKVTRTSYITVAADLTPSAAFTGTPTSIIAGQSVSFTHTGSNGNTPATYQWDFGDATANGTTENPTHQYTAAGTYTVVLTITDIDGDNNKVTQTSYITVAADLTPSATFTGTPTLIAIGQSVTFTHSGSNGNTPATYQWDFGDATANGTTENPTHQYTAAGTYTVVLTITDVDGDSNKVTQPNYISVVTDLTPSATFTGTPTSIVAGQSVTFTHTGSNGDMPATYQWDFGDLTANGTTENPTHQYVTAGTYTVVLTVTDTDGDSNKVTRTSYITVAADLTPSATFTGTPTSIIASQSVTFTHTGSNGNTPATYQWDFGDATANGTTENPVHQYTTVGTYTVVLTVTDVDGDSNKVTQASYITVTADLAPSASFTNSTSCSILAGQIVNFTHTGGNGNLPATYQWSFGDQTTNATSENPAHQFLRGGTFTITLTVTDVDGDSSTTSRIDFVTVAPRQISVVQPGNTTFTNNFTISLEYLADFVPASGHYLLDGAYSIPLTSTSFDVATYANSTAFFERAHSIQAIAVDEFSITYNSSLRWFTVAIVNTTILDFVLTAVPMPSYIDVTVVIVNQGPFALHNLTISFLDSADYNILGQSSYLIPTLQVYTNTTITIRLERVITKQQYLLPVQAWGIGYKRSFTYACDAGSTGNDLLLIIVMAAIGVGIIAIAGVAGARRKKASVAKKLKGKGKEKGGESIARYTDAQGAPARPVQPSADTLGLGAKVLPTELVAKKKQAAKPSEGEAVVQPSPEELAQSETEMKVDMNVDRCIVCKKELAGDVFICPSCKNAKYHHQCVEHLISGNEPCWFCKKPLLPEEAKKEVEALQLKLQYIMKNLQDIGDKFKKNEMTEEAFFSAYNQFKKDKEEIEKQLKSKMT
nr:PKD domain-containing protein [Candidatus Sigynarchaeota archaeon]